MGILPAERQIFMVAAACKRTLAQRRNWGNHSISYNQHPCVLPLLLVLPCHKLSLSPIQLQ